MIGIPEQNDRKVAEIGFQIAVVLMKWRNTLLVLDQGT